MFKRLLFSILALNIIGNANAVIYFPSGITASHIKAANDIQIAWDIHNVLAKKDGGAKAGAILGNIFTIGWTKMTGNKAWDEINKLPKNVDLSGEVYVTIFLKHGETKLAQFALLAANAYKPRKGMEQIVREIDSKGIPQRLASNIGPQCLANLDTKFKSKKFNCLIFDIIKPGKIVDFSKYSNESYTNLPSALTPFIKPDPAFFADYTRTYGQGKNSLIIFIDDKIENIQAAIKVGWIGIHFDVNKKDPVAQLRADLRRLGII